MCACVTYMRISNDPEHRKNNVCRLKSQLLLYRMAYAECRMECQIENCFREIRQSAAATPLRESRDSQRAGERMGKCAKNVRRYIATSFHSGRTN